MPSITVDSPVSIAAGPTLGQVIVSWLESFKWDSAQKGPNVTLSPDGLTATQGYDTSERNIVLANIAHDAGQYVLRFVPSFDPANSLAGVIFGLTADTDGTGTNYMASEIGGQISCSGGASNFAGSFSGDAIESGEGVTVWVDFDAGKIGRGPFGTGPFLSFPPNTPLRPFAYLTADEEGFQATMTLIPGYEDGVGADAW